MWVVVEEDVDVYVVVGCYCVVDVRQYCCVIDLLLEVVELGLVYFGVVQYYLGVDCKYQEWEQLGEEVGYLDDYLIVFVVFCLFDFVGVGQLYQFVCWFYYGFEF